MAQATAPPRRPWQGIFSRKPPVDEESPGPAEKSPSSMWNMGMLNDRETIEVPGSVLLLAKGRNEPLGLRNAPARTSHSSLPTGVPEPPHPVQEDKKMTNDGQIILEPQPDDSHNDPLNWAVWRRDSALLCLGLYCMIGGGITPLIAAGFTNVAEDLHVPVSQVSLTTGLYMMGLGIGSVIFSPTAILYGKRPVYLFGAILWILATVWCALSPNFISLLLARIVQGIAVSPVECLPSATIAEIFFLHERAFRIGIYTLLLLGGKNLVPLVSAAVIQSLGWRWAFWIVAIVVGFSGILIYLLVPETFWDRSPLPKVRKPTKRPSFFSRRSSRNVIAQVTQHGENPTPGTERAQLDLHHEKLEDLPSPALSQHHRQKNVHVGFAPNVEEGSSTHALGAAGNTVVDQPEARVHGTQTAASTEGTDLKGGNITLSPPSSTPAKTAFTGPELGRSNSTHQEETRQGYFGRPEEPVRQDDQISRVEAGNARSDTESEKFSLTHVVTKGQAYTHNLREAPPKSFSQQLRIYHGRLNNDKWWKVALRPFVLFAYPAVLWSSAIYACSIGWLIVISESVAIIYRQGSYKFGALATGLVYISPFIGGILGTAVAGRVSDVIVKAMARRNGGLYEPEFRLVMAAPIAVTTVIGLMGFGWSANINDHWIVPTVFFGIVSFGCSLGSTTSITFCVDSYRQYAGEALVTLNFSKNIFHGLIFSLFVTGWLEHDGSKTVFIWIGVIQLIFIFSTIPMYIYGKRARMWTHLAYFRTYMPALVSKAAIAAPSRRTFSASRRCKGQNLVHNSVRRPDDLHTNILLSSSARKPLITLWTTNWCATCKVVSPLLTELVESGVGEAEGGVHYCTVEYDCPDIMSDGLGMRYMITSIPTLLSIDAGEAQVETKTMDARKLADRQWLEEWIRNEARRHGGRGGGGSGSIFGGLFGSFR
ncbi:putative Major facilitator superfamily (MFS) profile domain-containing protein [Seiridium cardinale]|uniref:Major facilitator superfamily (MFS) profile domain-containing protein n=1 Tax=Seiridium cardinale TaxID=138064 RepID=A0ABR2XU48_9PEZI